MGIELLFGLVLIAFIAVWVLWLLCISRGIVIGIAGTFVVLVALFLLILPINEERRDQQHEARGEALREFIALVSEEQAAAYERDGSYNSELPELSEELREHPGSIFQQEESLEPELVGERNTYEVSGQIADQSFALAVTRGPGGELEEERTCGGSEAAGCDDGSW